MSSKRQETSSMQQFWVTFVVSCWFYLSLFRSRFRTFFLLRLHLAVVPSNETKDNVKWPLPPPSPGIPSPRVWPLRFKIQISFAETQPSTTSSIAELRCFCWTGGASFHRSTREDSQTMELFEQQHNLQLSGVWRGCGDINEIYWEESWAWNVPTAASS